MKKLRNIKYCNRFAQSISRNGSVNTSEQAAMEEVSQWMNVIAHC
jgi:hypothetical protein